MSIILSNNAITVTGTTGNNISALKTFFDANNTAGFYDEGCFYVTLPLRLEDAALFTSDNGVVWEFRASARLELASLATIDFAADNVIYYKGNPKNHSAINGTILYRRLTFIINVPQNGRNDFSNNTAAWQGTDIRFVIYGNQLAFLHMEDNQGKANMQGRTEILNYKTGGQKLYIQFDPASEPADTNGDRVKTYKGFSLPAHATTTPYMPRLTQGIVIHEDITLNHTSTIEMPRGGRFDEYRNGRCVLRNPFFPNAPSDNLLPIERWVFGASPSAALYDGEDYLAEEFSFWPLSVIDDTDPFNIRITHDGIVDYDAPIIGDNLSSYTPTGSSQLQQVLWVETRRTDMTGLNSRKTIDARNVHTIRIRRKDRLDVDFENYTFNSPLTYRGNPSDDVSYVESPVTDAEIFYNNYKEYLANNLHIEHLVARNGDTLNCDSYNVVLDGASDDKAITINGNILTYNSQVFAGNITTTGVVSVANGANINGGIIDANGDSFIVFDAIDNWAVYASEANSNSNNNPLGSGGAGDIYRFNYIEGLTYYVRLTVAGQTILTQQAVTLGRNVISLNTASQLQALSGTINDAVIYAREAAMNTQPL